MDEGKTTGAGASEFNYSQEELADTTSMVFEKHYCWVIDMTNTFYLFRENNEKDVFIYTMSFQKKEKIFNSFF